MKTSQRLEGIGEYYFSQKLREIDAMNKAGKQVINLGIGSPDLPPHPDVIRVLKEESDKDHVHAYQSYKGSPVLRQAMSDWYARWYGVSLDPENEILPLIGSKEGIMHICMTYLDEKDGALIPNPGYPTYKAAVKLAGGEPISYSLHPETDWHPDFNELTRLVEAHRAQGHAIKLLFVNYPHMPTGKVPDAVFFKDLIAFARQQDILIVHDNPYSFILNDHPMSLLSIEGAREYVLELNSLSKSQNMAGWRVGMLCADKKRIEEVLRFKSNMDSGMFLPVQLAAARALKLEQDWYDKVNAVYKARRDKVFDLLDLLNCRYEKGQAGMFVWAAAPDSYTDGFALSDEVLHQANVFITPGGIFGSVGNGFIRVSLCASEEKILESIERIKKSRQ
ncbi:MAG: aminotransferase class I/II-fold pyridoxal phosphate-dependent enzyme [Chitinophagaceae bacterium]|nr:aminotransferase class I/II-fold pyridoxal phosphate-dependent enzyme [Chitinophagaceae bacterium]